MREVVLCVLVAGLAGAATASDDVGARLYAERCVACHGQGGRGDGPVAAALQPPPRNFRDAGFWRTRTLAELETVVRDGRPGTLMQAFGSVLSESEIEAVVRHLTTFRPDGNDATGGDGEASGAGTREDASGGPDRR